jgi:hypothetical protein
MASYMVHWVTRPDYDRFLDTGVMPLSGSFAEEMDRGSIDGLSPGQLAQTAMLGLAKHTWYARNLRMWAGDKDARVRVELSLDSVHQTEDRVFVVCGFS